MRRGDGDAHFHKAAVPLVPSHSLWYSRASAGIPPGAVRSFALSRPTLLPPYYPGSSALLKRVAVGMRW